MTKLEDMQFELAVDRKALVEDRGRLVRSEERESTLPETPDNFRPLYGSYQRVSQESQGSRSESAPDYGGKLTSTRSNRVVPSRTSE